MIICDNQAFTLLMLKKRQCMVMRGGGWGVAGEPPCDCSRLIIHRNALWSLLQKRVTEAVNTHLRRIYDSDTLLGGLSTCFMTGTIRGDISFFMCDTYNHENASFLPATSWLMSKSSRCEISAEFKVGRITRFNECLNLENYFILNIYDKGTLHITRLSCVKI